jgi:hypothetical protein
MLTNNTEIKEMMLTEWDHLTEDDLYEIADGLVPVYYSDTIAQWRDLEMDDTDTWQETIGEDLNKDTTIFSLMNIDLFNYYLKQVEALFAEINEEKEELELEEA